MLVALVAIGSLFGTTQPIALSAEAISAAFNAPSDSVISDAVRDSLRPMANAVGDSVVAQQSQQPTASRRARRSTERTSRRQTGTSLSDSIKPAAKRDSLIPLAPKPDTTTARAKRQGGGGLDEIIEGKNTDSLCYDVLNKRVYIYNQGDIK